MSRSKISYRLVLFTDSFLFDKLYFYWSSFIIGPDSNGTQLLKTCCGTTHTAVLESSNDEMYILFETDNTVGALGFAIEYFSNGITTTTTTTTVAPPTTTGWYM